APAAASPAASAGHRERCSYRHRTHVHPSGRRPPLPAFGRSGRDRELPAGRGLCGRWPEAAGGGEVIARGDPAGKHTYLSTQKQADAASVPEQIRGWLTGRLPGDWFEGAPEILIDREEITVIGHLPGPGSSAAAGGGKAARAKGAASAKGAAAARGT